MTSEPIGSDKVRRSRYYMVRSAQLVPLVGIFAKCIVNEDECRDVWNNSLRALLILVVF